MSIIKITDHNESIYGLKRRELPTVSSPKFPQSNFRKKITQNADKIPRGTHATFGVELQPPNPLEFLKKNKPPQPRQVTAQIPVEHFKAKHLYNNISIYIILQTKDFRIFNYTLYTKITSCPLCTQT